MCGGDVRRSARPAGRSAPATTGPALARPCACRSPGNVPPPSPLWHSFFGAFFGATAGRARTYAAHQHPPVQLARVAALGPARAARRLALGFALVLAAKEGSKRAARAALPPLYRFFPLALRRLWQPPLHSLCPPGAVQDPRLRELPHTVQGRPYDVEVTARFFGWSRGRGGGRAAEQGGAGRPSGPALRPARHSFLYLIYSTPLMSHRYAGLGFAVMELTPRLISALGW